MKTTEIKAFAAFENEDFGVLEEIDEEKDQIRIRKTHGTIFLVKMPASVTEWELVPFGVEDGDETKLGRIAFWRPYEDILKIAEEAGAV